MEKGGLQPRIEAIDSIVWMGLASDACDQAASVSLRLLPRIKRRLGTNAGVVAM
jgi:hypothetical protein